jgi:3-isopropylmalate/(R)-2-methylmalate dehydratase small subunit
MTSRIERVEGRALAVPGNDIDTDRIIPARFLKAITFDGLESHLFEDDRAQARAAGVRHPLDDPAATGAAVLLVNANFGCGSSREHAPQAIARRGFRAVVGESFAEIFAGNSLMIGLPCVTVSRDDARRLMDAVKAAPATPVVVDLRAGRVKAGDVDVALSMPTSAREALMSGTWDATGALLDNYDEVERAATRLPY